jgi:uncharacterized membrane protein YfhO
MSTQGQIFHAERLVLEANVDEFTNCEKDIRSSIHLSQDLPNHIQIELFASKPGWLMIADTWYPGWEAKVNGDAVDIVRGNYIFRALPIHEGKNHIELIFSPLSFKLGLAISVFSILLLTAISINQKRDRKKKDIITK